ncbi:MAG: polysaccharide biosynthesis C-terminal domain-containing protein [Bacteroidales bacterium]|nr:polysaccharide biosynthesis C-terminal domain-containing protein [Bacteroidales bacterium]
MKISKQINNTSGLQFFQLFRYAILLLIGILFTKTSLTTSEIGFYESLIFLASALSFFWISGLVQSLLVVYKEPEKGKKSPELFNAFLLMLFFSLLAFIVIRVFTGNICNYLNLSGETDLYKLFSWYILLISPSYLIEYIFLLKNKPKNIVLYGLISYSLQLLLVVLPVLFGYALINSIYGLVVIAILRFLWLIRLLIKYSVIKVSFSYIKNHISLGYPLIFSSLLSGSGEYIDGLIISNYFDSATFAIFRFGAKEFPLFLILANAFSNSMIPEFSKDLEIGIILGKIKRNSLKLIYYFFPISIILIITSHYFYPIVFNKDFSESADIFNVYVLLIITRFIFPQTIIIGHKNTKIMMISSLIEIIVNVSVSLLLIKPFGIVGVAFGTLAAYSVEKIILVFYANFKLKIKPGQYIPIFQYILLSFILIVVFIGVLFFV